MMLLVVNEPSSLPDRSPFRWPIRFVVAFLQVTGPVVSKYKPASGGYLNGVNRAVLSYAQRSKTRGYVYAVLLS